MCCKRIKYGAQKISPLLDSLKYNLQGQEEHKMGDEKRREELKAKINEQLDKLSIEELESIAGGEGGKKKIYRVDGYTKQGIHIKIDFNNYDGAMHLCKALKLSLDCIKVVYV
jgi:hypothetical protein